MSAGRYTVEETPAGFHVVLVGANGEPVLTSEVYTRRETAEHAIEIAAQTSLGNLNNHAVAQALAKVLDGLVLGEDLQGLDVVVEQLADELRASGTLVTE